AEATPWAGQATDRFQSAPTCARAASWLWVSSVVRREVAKANRAADRTSSSASQAVEPDRDSRRNARYEEGSRTFVVTRSSLLATASKRRAASAATPSKSSVGAPTASGSSPVPGPPRWWRCSSVSAAAPSSNGTSSYGSRAQIPRLFLESRWRSWITVWRSRGTDTHTQAQGTKHHATEPNLARWRVEADRKRRSGQRRAVGSASNERQPQACQERNRQRRDRRDRRLRRLNRRKLARAGPPRCQDRQLERLTLELQQADAEQHTQAHQGGLAGYHVDRRQPRGDCPLGSRDERRQAGRNGRPAQGCAYPCARLFLPRHEHPQIGDGQPAE